MKREGLDAFLAVLAASPQRLVADAAPEALSAHVADALTVLPLLEGREGPLVDVGSGAGLPGVPLLLARPDLTGLLVDSRARRCEHLREALAAAGLDDRVRVACARAEELGRGAERDAAGLVVARALAPPPVAVELCLPLLRPGGRLVLQAGEVDEGAVAAAAEALGGRLEPVVAVPGFERRTLVPIAKVAPTPAGFPRRVGEAARRPIVRPAQ